MLARGQLSDALTHYHAAVEGDPDNYLTLFKRGTVYLALGKARFAQEFSNSNQTLHRHEFKEVHYISKYATIKVL